MNETEPREVLVSKWNENLQLPHAPCFLVLNNLPTPMKRLFLNLKQLLEWRNSVKKYPVWQAIAQDGSRSQTFVQPGLSVNIFISRSALRRDFCLSLESSILLHKKYLFDGHQTNYSFLKFQPGQFLLKNCIKQKHDA